MRHALRTIAGFAAISVGLLAFAASAEEPTEPKRERLPLPVPAAAAEDPAAIELARVWVARGRLQVALRVDAVEDPVQWGAILAEIARHIANSAVESRGADRTEVLDGIVLGFQASLNHTPQGLDGSISP